MYSYSRNLGQSHNLINGLVTLLHHDQYTHQIQSDRVLYVKKHKPLGPVAESSFLSLSASVSSEEDGEAVSPIASDEERSYYMAACQRFHLSR